MDHLLPHVFAPLRILISGANGFFLDIKYYAEATKLDGSPSASKLWEFACITYKKARILAAIQLYSISNIRGCKFLGHRFEPHRVLFLTTTKLSPQHETLYVISTLRLGGCSDQTLPIVPILVQF